MNIPTIVKFIIALMATASVGLTLMILINFFRSAENSLKEKWPSYLILIGYGSLLAAISRSVFKEVYKTVDAWHFLTMIGLVCSLAGLIPVFRQVVKKNEQERLHDHITKIKNKNQKL